MHSSSISTILFSVLLGLTPTQAASTLRCEDIRIDNHSFDLSKLGGPHSVVTSKYVDSTESHLNTTYTLDICKPLKKSGKTDKKKECPNGTRVCAIEHFLQGDTDKVADVIAIAGALENTGGSSFDSEVTRLKTSDSNSDSQKEGLRVVLKGGKHPLNGPVKERRPQKAVIEFLCDHDKVGSEGEWKAEDQYERRADDEKNDDKDGGKKDDEKDGDDKDDDKKGDDDKGDGESSLEHQLKNKDAALIWEGFDHDGDNDVLRLTWHTKYACESKRDGDKDDDGDVSTSWGFFTWFVIIIFLGVASYLIFGSWLNYNRYGARGWDLLPHGDTIRDIPYLLKDWTRRVLNSVQGAGSRGGYSAV